MSITSFAFQSPVLVFAAAFLLRLILFFYGIYQDAHSALKYTDIDYYVFTDAARAVSRGYSPYVRATYRYTPLLAWILVPTSWSGKDGLWFHSGKALFALSDLVAGWLIWQLLQQQGMPRGRALKFASVWLLNPMVANISTRGSSEGLLCALVMATLHAFETRQIVLAGSLLGLAVHFKIYPFIYGVSMFWALKVTPEPSSSFADLKSPSKLLSKDRLNLVLSSLFTFAGLNAHMANIYGQVFLEHTFLYHFTRSDHRHNFSVYNTLLYFSSASSSASTPFSVERLAFLPQLLLSAVLLPLLLSTTVSLPTTMLAQTLAFVSFNKVCTSQYFLWYLIFLPLYLPHSSLLKDPRRKGLPALAAWVGGQAFWLARGYQLEFMGRSSWLGLFVASAVFFLVNCWLLGIVVEDGGALVEERLEKTKRRAAGESKLSVEKDSGTAK